VAIAGDGSPSRSDAPPSAAHAALTDPVAGALEGDPGWRLRWRRSVGAVHPQPELVVYERVEPGVNAGSGKGGIDEGVNGVGVNVACVNGGGVNEGGVNKGVMNEGCVNGPAAGAPLAPDVDARGVNSRALGCDGVRREALEGGCTGDAPFRQALEEGGVGGAVQAWGAGAGGSRSGCGVGSTAEDRQWTVRLVGEGRGWGGGGGSGEGSVGAGGGDAPSACLLDRMEWSRGREGMWGGGREGACAGVGTAAVGGCPIGSAPAAPVRVSRLRLPFLNASSVRVRVRVREVAAGASKNSSRLEVIPEGGEASAHSGGRAAAEWRLVRLGHQEGGAGESACPASAVSARDVGTVRLAAVALVVDPEACTGGGAVLLTRRPGSMRSFPRAWVLPGGGVDASDAGVGAAALRELEEETGLRIGGGGGGGADESCSAGFLRVGSTRLLCLWESCYPVTAAAWALAAAGGGGAEGPAEQGEAGIGGTVKSSAGISAVCSLGGMAARAPDVGSVGIRPRHHLIAYVHVSAPGAASLPLSLQPGECDAACWVPLRDMRQLLSGAGGGGARSYALAAGAAGGCVEAERLRGVYPNTAGEGIGRGHCFALETLLSLGEEQEGGGVSGQSAE
jgi:8-oxo-dGTP pyrophosphatase MutT (NUDIX family)